MRCKALLIVTTYQACETRVMSNHWFMMKRFSFSIFVLSVCLLLSKTVDADLLLQFGKDGQIGVTNVALASGGTFTLDVYMTQTGLDPSNGLLGDFRLSPGSNARGLGSFFFDLSVTNAANGISQVDVLPMNPTTFAYASGFADLTQENVFLDPLGNTSPTPTAQARFVGLAPASLGPGGLTVAPAYVTQPHNVIIGPNTGSVVDNSILLGTVAFNVAPGATGLYNLNFSVPGSIQRPTLGNDPTSGQVDVTFVGTTLSVTAIPEPTSISLAAFIGSFMYWRHRRRKVSL